MRGPEAECLGDDTGRSVPRADPGAGTGEGRIAPPPEDAAAEAGSGGTLPLAAEAGRGDGGGSTLSDGAAGDRRRAASRPEPPRIAGYAITGTLGRGGISVVYRGIQEGLNRPVAVKVAGDRPAISDMGRRFFRAEAEALGRLDHPNIVRVYDARIDYDEAYLVMEYLDGANLHAFARGATPRRAAEVVATLAAAIGYAHARGVIHGDLKPKNVILLADGTPKIIDFNLAVLDLDAPDGPEARAGPRAASPPPSASGDPAALDPAPIGTPSYMAPEQTGKHAWRIGLWTDVHGLGAVLYHLLTGRAPFRAETIERSIWMSAYEPPEAPRRVRPEIPRALEAICLRCLEKDPARRFPDADRLARALEAHLASGRVSRLASDGLTRAREALTARVRVPAGPSTTAWAGSARRAVLRAGHLTATPLRRWLVGLGATLAGAGRARPAAGIAPDPSSPDDPGREGASAASLLPITGFAGEGPNLTIMPASRDEHGREIARIVIADRVAVGECVYPLRLPLEGIFRSNPEGPGEFRVRAEGLDLVGRGEAAGDAFADWRLELHAAFQALRGKPESEMSPAERDRWGALSRAVDVAAYEAGRPVVLRQIGRVERARPRPSAVAWPDGRVEAVDLESLPPEFAGFPVGQWFEALIERDRRSLGLLRALYVRPIAPPPPPAEAGPSTLPETLPAAGDPPP